MIHFEIKIKLFYFQSGILYGFFEYKGARLESRVCVCSCVQSEKDAESQKYLDKGSDREHEGEFEDPYWHAFLKAQWICSRGQFKF